MRTAPIFISSTAYDPLAKTRPANTPMLDLHLLGITEIEGEPIQQFAVVPASEPGSLLEVVAVSGRATLVTADPGSPSLLPGPRLLICDSAGSGGEVAVAVLLESEEGNALNSALT